MSIKAHNIIPPAAKVLHIVLHITLCLLGDVIMLTFILRSKLFDWNFYPLEVCLANAIHNFKWVKKNWFEKIEVNYFEILLIDVTFYL